MNGAFIMEGEATREVLDWGTLDWIAHPPNVGSSYITFIRVSVLPGGGHNFHKHPDQEETIYVNKGQIVQWLEEEKRTMNVGDTVFIPADVVHASFNEGDEPAEMIVFLGPCVGTTGYETVDMSAEEPWASLR